MKAHKQNRKSRTGNRSDEKGQRGDRQQGERSTPADRLHQAIGNRAVQALHEEVGLQAKLEVSSPDDSAEKEAIRVADAVMRMGDGSSRATGDDSDIGAENRVDRDRTPSQTVSADKGASGAVDEETESLVRSGVQGNGKSLPDETRASFESKMGADFSDVRVHTGSTANEAARSINAEAYTIGADIVFADGKYRPKSFLGRQLLAHELAHTLQQSGSNEKLKHDNSSQNTVARAVEPDENEETQGQTINELADKLTKEVNEGPLPVYPDFDTSYFVANWKGSDYTDNEQIRERLDYFYQSYTTWIELFERFINSYYTFRGLGEREGTDLVDVEYAIMDLEDWEGSIEASNLLETPTPGVMSSAASQVMETINRSNLNLEALEQARHNLRVTKLEYKEKPDAAAKVAEIEELIDNIDAVEEVLRETIVGGMSGGAKKAGSVVRDEAFDRFSLGRLIEARNLEAAQSRLERLETSIRDGRIELAEGDIDLLQEEVGILANELEGRLNEMDDAAGSLLAQYSSIGANLEDETGIDGLNRAFVSFAWANEVQMYWDLQYEYAQSMDLIDIAGWYRSLRSNDLILINMGLIGAGRTQHLVWADNMTSFLFFWTTVMKPHLEQQLGMFFREQEFAMEAIAGEHKMDERLDANNVIPEY